MITKFEGIALGGPVAGEMISHHLPTKRVMPKTVLLGSINNGEDYFYVPLVGFQGFWIAQSETKGTGPWDDIVRILSEYYVTGHKS